MLTTAPGGPPGASEPRSGAGSTSSRVTAPMPSIWMLSPRRRSNLVGSPPSAGAQPKVATHSCRSECRPSHRRIPASTCTGGIDDRIGRASPFSTPAGSGALRVNGRVHHNRHHRNTHQHHQQHTHTPATPPTPTTSTRGSHHPTVTINPPQPHRTSTPATIGNQEHTPQCRPTTTRRTPTEHHHQPPPTPPPTTTTTRSRSARTTITA